MRKCERCQLTFYSNRRLYCLYCDSRLVEVYVDRETVFENLEPTAQKITAAREPMTHQRMEFLVGSYFKSKSFTFSYSFSRNQFKMGEKFPRFLIQPVRFDFLIKIPWLLIDLLDSILFRLVFNGFCPHCRWKHSKSFEAEPHDPRECEYNREYGIVVKDRKSTRLNSSHLKLSRMPSSA